MGPTERPLVPCVMCSLRAPSAPTEFQQRRAGGRGVGAGGDGGVLDTPVEMLRQICQPAANLSHLSTRHLHRYRELDALY